MHSVQRSPEPDFIAGIRTICSQWEDLNGADRSRIRDELVRDFGMICAYCEQPCQQPTATNKEPNEESVDHFRPRNRFPDQWLDWLNMMYACRRCNQAKGGNWPGFDDGSINQLLVAGDSRYTSVSEYVNPNAVGGQKPARDFFEYDAKTGEIAPSEKLDEMEWSIARRTIRDVDLNDSGLGENDPNHLWNLRVRQRRLLARRLIELDDFDAKVNIMLEFMLPDKPFSSFIAAYVRNRFPLFGRVF